MSNKPDVEKDADEAAILKRLLSTPPQPKAKPKEGEPAKKRGRPPKAPRKSGVD